MNVVAFSERPPPMALAAQVKILILARLLADALRELPDIEPMLQGELAKLLGERP